MMSRVNNRSMTLEMTGSSEIGRCDLSFFGIGIILAIFHLVVCFASGNDEPEEEVLRG